MSTSWILYSTAVDAKGLFLTVHAKGKTRTVDKFQYHFYKYAIGMLLEYYYSYLARR